MIINILLCMFLVPLWILLILVGYAICRDVFGG